jgi:hypothetical protein
MRQRRHYLSESGLTAIRPRHARKFAHHSREWFEACDRAFVKAMRAHLDERPRALARAPASPCYAQAAT